MKLISKFDAENPKEIYGSLFTPDYVGNKNGVFCFSDDHFTFKAKDRNYRIEYSAIKSIKTVREFLSCHIRVDADKIYYLFVPNLKFYYNFLINRNSLIQMGEYKIGKWWKWVNIFFYFLVVDLFFVAMDLIQNSIERRGSLKILIFGILFLNTALSIVLFISRKEWPLKKGKLFLFIWGIPIMGGLFVGKYFSRFLSIRSHSRSK